MGYPAGRRDVAECSIWTRHGPLYPGDNTRVLFFNGNLFSLDITCVCGSSFQWEFIFRSVPHAFFWGIVCVSTRHLLSSCFPSSSLVLGLFVSWACLCHCMHMHVGMIVLGAHVFQWELIFVNITCVCGSLVA